MLPEQPAQKYNSSVQSLQKEMIHVHGIQNYCLP